MSEIVDCIGYIIRKTCWSLLVFMKFIFLRLLDLFGLIFNVAACCTIIRLPFMIAQFSKMRSFEEWRFIGLVHLLIFLIDIPIIIMGLIVFITLWRIYPCMKELKKEWSGFDSWRDHDLIWTGFDIRYVIVKHFFTLFIDVFCIPSAIICLLSWRSYIFIKKIKKAKDDWKRRKICFQECCQVFFDIPLLLCFIPVIISWRLPFVLHNIKKDSNNNRKWNKMRFRGIKHLFYLLVDIPCIILFIITLLTWRSPILIWQICLEPEEDIYRKRIQWKLRKTICLQFLYFFVDIPCIVACLFVIGTIWRIPSALNRLKLALVRKRKRSNFYKKEFAVREVIILEFGMIFVDLFCLIMTVILLVSLWRAYPIIQEVRKYIRRYQNSEKRIIQKMSLTPQIYGTFDSNSVIQEIPLNEPVKNNDDKLSESASESSDNIAELEGNQLTNGIDNDNIDFVTEHADIEEKRSSAKQEAGEYSEYVMVDREVDPVTETGNNIDNEIETENNIDNETETENNIDNETEGIKEISWSKCTWKIRKAICINFGMLFLDIPAIPLSLFLMVTALRTSAFLSNIIVSGDFYMFFAVTVYYQSLRFFIDLFFLFLFLILMFLRPIQSWVHLLEDEEHKKYRLLCDIMLWVPDIQTDRHKCYDELDEGLMLSIKENIDIDTARFTLDNIFVRHLERIEKLLADIQKYEIEDEFGFLLKYLLFLERKRIGKLLRKYTLEQNYIQRTDVKLHNSNLLKWNNEMREFDKLVDVQYDKVVSYQPDKVQLYKTKTGLSLRSRKETRKVLIDCLPRGRLIVTMMAILCCIPIYRSPSMIKKLYKRWYNRYNIVVGTLKEYALDFLAIVRIFIVLVFVYRAPLLLADVFDCIIEKRSWKAVRSIVKKYPGDMLDDLVNVISTLFSWETPRFIVTAILFALLMPADMFLTVVKICISNKCISYVLTLFIYIIMMGFPFVFAFYGAEEILNYGLGYVNVVVICVFCGILLFTLLLMVMALVKDKKKTFLLEMPKCDYVRLNWYNINVLLFEILEFFQCMALIFKLTSIPMYGRSAFSDASKYLLFSFMPFKVMFWITVVMFIIWFFLCAFPVITENILEKYEIGRCGERASWRLAVSLFANTLFVTMIENLVSFSACRYESCPSNYTLGSIPTNSSCITSQFIEDSSYDCWVGTHKNYAVFGLIGLVWYCTTSLIFDTQYGDPETKEQDIGFSPIYNTVINVLKGIMVVAVSIVTDSNYAVIVVLFTCNLLSVVFSLSFTRLFCYKPSNLQSALVWRIFTYISCAITTVAVLVAFLLDDKSSKVPLIIIGVGIFVVFIMSIIITVKLKQISDIERDRKAFRKEILSLEVRITKNKWFLKKFDEERAMWKRLVKSVHEASPTDRKVKPSDWKIAEQTEPIENYILVTSDQPADPMKKYEGLVQSDISTSDTVISKDNIIVKISDDGLESQNISQPTSQPPPSYDIHMHHVSLGIPEIDELPKDVFRLEKNGRNLLLILEKLIRYDAFRYSFLSQRNIWKSAVWKSDWTGLLESLRILNGHLLGTYDKPTPLDISLAQPSLQEDKLMEDPQDQQTPPQGFIRQTKEMIAQNSEECRQRALNDFLEFSNYGSEWNQLFDKLLPTLPVIKSWEYSKNEHNLNSFTLTSRRPNTGVIVEIDDSKGNKLAKGASFTIGKVLKGLLSNGGVSFVKGHEPVAKKGPVTITVEQVSFVTKNNVLYIVANGKKVKFDVALASCKIINWT